MNKGYCEITMLPCPYAHDTCKECDLNSEYERAVELGKGIESTKGAGRLGQDAGSERMVFGEHITITGLKVH